MKSVGEVMAIGRSFQESLQKALRGLEIGKSGLDPEIDIREEDAEDRIVHELQNAGASRIWYLADAFRAGFSLDEIFQYTMIDRWFLIQIQELVQLEDELLKRGRSRLDQDFLRLMKKSERSANAGTLFRFTSG